MHKFLRFLSAGIIILSTVVFSPGQASAESAISSSNQFWGIAGTPEGCVDVHFIFARGSGETVKTGRSFLAWKSALETLLQGSDLTYSFYDLGTSKQGFGAQYPAVAVANRPGSFFTMLGAFVSAGEGYKYGSSVSQGSAELRSYLLYSVQSCPNTKYVLGGYSQGAQVLSSPASDLYAYNNRILYVATFGNPKLYLPEGGYFNAPACSGRNLSPYRAYVPDCHAFEGILGSVRPYFNDKMQYKVGAWCNDHDIMCSSGLSFDDHSLYISKGLYQNAAAKILSRLQQNFPSKNFPAYNAQFAIGQNVVILLDNTSKTTNFQASQTYQRAKTLAAQVYALGGKVALYTYSDGLTGTVKARCDFSCTSSEFQQALDQVSSKTLLDGTFDTTLNTIHSALSGLKWQVGANKSIIALSSRKLNSAAYNRNLLSAVVKLSLAIDPVNIYAITDDQTEKSVYQDLASATNGQVFSESDTAQAFTSVTNRPNIALNSQAYRATIGETLTFKAASSNNSTLTYDWDLDFDGVFEYRNTGSAMTASYDAATTGYVQVRATDANGLSSTMSAEVTITAKSDRPSWITGLEMTELDEETFHIKFATNVVTDRVLLVVDDLPLGYFDVSGRQEFTLQDVPASGANVRLMSYNTSGERSNQALEFTVKPGIKLPDFYLEDPYQEVEPVETPDSEAGSNIPSQSGDTTSDSVANQPTTPSNRPTTNQESSSSTSSTSSVESSTNTISSVVNRFLSFETVKNQATEIQKSQFQASSLIPKVPNTGVDPTRGAS